MLGERSFRFNFSITLLNAFLKLNKPILKTKQNQEEEDFFQSGNAEAASAHHVHQHDHLHAHKAFHKHKERHCH